MAVLTFLLQTRQHEGSLPCLLKSTAAFQRILGALSLLCVLTAALSLTAMRATAQNDDKRAPLGVILLPPYTQAHYAFQNLALAKQLSEQLCSALKEKGLPARSFAIPVEEAAFDDPQALRKIAGRNKVAWLLRGKITQLKFEVADDFLTYRLRTSISMSVDLVDAATGKVLRKYESKGLLSLKVPKENNQKPTGNEFVLHTDGASYAAHAGGECVNGDGKKNIGLAATIAKDYPDVPWTIPSTSNVQAQLRVDVKADTREAAAQSGVREIFNKLVPNPSEMQMFHLQQKLLPNAEKLVTVEETEKGVYAVSVRIDDLQSDRPNLARELKQLGDLQLSSIGVLCADATLQAELQGALTKATFNVKDEQRLAALRNRAYVENMLEGKADPLALQSLKDAANGFDYIVLADVAAENKGAHNGASSVLARVRVKIIDPSTATFIFVDDGEESDEDETPRAALERAIKSAARLTEPRLLEDLYKHISSKTGVRILSLTLAGWKKYGDAERFRRDLAKLPGVLAAEKENYESGILFLKVEVTEAARKSLGLDLEENDLLKKYGLQVEDDKATSIRAKRDPDQPIASADADAIPVAKAVKPPVSGGKTGVTGKPGKGGN